MLNEYQTQIIFNEHKLVLRYKARDDDSTKFEYIIYEEWDGPTPGSTALPSRAPTSNPDSGRIATPVLDRSRASEINRTVLITKVQSEVAVPETITHLKEKYFTNDLRNIVRIEHKTKDIYAVICNSWQSGKNLVEKYKGIKFNEDAPEMELFSETDPIET